ncbi:cysteine--tRNA ligase [Candidatus Woesearchaeota archaeon]|nr:cysteine--tRNA ligase [Candidatus Woesearchaeota archaeon]
MSLKLFNTFTRKIEEFKPISKDKVGLYTCGPTVYWYAHIGNLRTYVFEDILKRVLLYNGFKVKHVMNMTDVGHLTSDADEGEDKMIKALRREGKEITFESVLEVAQHYTDAFMNDIGRLNILKPDIICAATEHVNDMIKLIQRIEKNGYTYETDTAVYFDVMKFKDYGKMANLKLDEQKAGARVEVDPNKKHPLDFALWFKAVGKHAKHIMQWDSPWGRGFPGWHIECSAMSMKYLGDQFDIHCGGIDHIPIHHTNEIAQSEAATGKKWVNYWLHGEFLLLDKGKMAKSGDKILIIETLVEKGFDPLDYRYFLLNAHYRKQLSFTFEALENARNSCDKLKSKVLEIKNGESGKHNVKKIKLYKEKFIEYVNDDLNMPQALAVLWDLIKDKELGNKDKYELILDFDKVLGLRLDEVKEEKVDVPEEVMNLVKQREEARKNKDWSKSDELRDKILEKGFKVEDSKEGSVVRKV